MIAAIVEKMRAAAPLATKSPNPSVRSGGGSEVQGVAEIARDRLDLVADGVEDEAVSEDEREEPGEEQADRRGRGEQPQQAVVGLFRAAVAKGADDPPRPANQVSRDPEPARRRARHDDCLEQVPEGQRQHEHAEAKGDHFHGRRSSHGPLCDRDGARRAEVPCFVRPVEEKPAEGRERGADVAGWDVQRSSKKWSRLRVGEIAERVADEPASQREAHHVPEADDSAVAVPADVAEPAGICSEHRFVERCHIARREVALADAPGEERRDIGAERARPASYSIERTLKWWMTAAGAFVTRLAIHWMSADRGSIGRVCRGRDVPVVTLFARVPRRPSTRMQVETV